MKLYKFSSYPCRSPTRATEFTARATTRVLSSPMPASQACASRPYLFLPTPRLGAAKREGAGHDELAMPRAGLCAPPSGATQGALAKPLAAGSSIPLRGDVEKLACGRG